MSNSKVPKTAKVLKHLNLKGEVAVGLKHGIRS